MAFLVSLSRGGSVTGLAIVVGGAVVVASLIRSIVTQASCRYGGKASSLSLSNTRLEACLPHRLEVYVPISLSNSLSDRLGAGNLDILFAVPGNGTVR